MNKLMSNIYEKYPDQCNLFTVFISLGGFFFCLFFLLSYHIEVEKTTAYDKGYKSGIASTKSTKTDIEIGTQCMAWWFGKTDIMAAKDRICK